MLAVLPATGAVAATTSEVIPLFSRMAAGESLPADLKPIFLPGVARNRIALVKDKGATVLQVVSDNSAGSVTLPYRVDPATTPVLSWQWKVSRSLTSADMRHKSGDDYAARIYVFFDVPLASLSFGERTTLRLARAISGTDVPTAAICYVWDNRHPIGTTGDSPYTGRVKKIVLQSGEAHSGEWVRESRDVAADFRRLFGREAPRVTGVAVGNDTDNTHEKVIAWFGDVEFRMAPP